MNLRRGLYNYNFSFKIPDDSPPSYRGRFIDSVIKYEGLVDSPTLLPYTARGELYVVREYKGKIKEKMIDGGGGDIHFSLLTEEPIIGFQDIKGFILIHRAPNVRRIAVELCILEMLRHLHLGIFKHEYSVLKCIARRTYIIKGETTKQVRFSISLGKPFKGTFIYTSPYEDKNIRIHPYLRITFYRKGRREKTYEIPLEWYVWSEREYEHGDTMVEKEISKYRDTLTREILRFFETYEEGDPMDVYLYLSKEGYETSVEEISNLLDELVAHSILLVVSEDSILRKYRINI